MIRRPPRSTHCISSAASDVYKRQLCSSFSLTVSSSFSAWSFLMSSSFLLGDLESCRFFTSSYSDLAVLLPSCCLKLTGESKVKGSFILWYPYAV
eukprot:TRINITY_DN2757_c0_g5_i1.p1 TRINITY_DN2757_c0_g5~~TRINITY_DN2757_c0_g5_i1.p1  ORF type:complete len:102 (+),score=14.96 TRINITY_DN2757_c0_g5_i1:23-307(+)